MEKRALISVSNKENIVPFAKKLETLGYEIISTGGTLKMLVASGVSAKSVETITNFPEILDGRVKTLHPMVHGGLLAKRDEKTHVHQIQENQIGFIDLVVVNLYPFKETVTKQGTSEAEIIENIDIGGPTMLRAAAKNFNDVLVIVDPTDYDDVIKELETGDVKKSVRKALAAKVFRHTAHYDAMIARYFNETTEVLFPENYTVTYEKVQDLRYGENPHQQAAFYEDVQYQGVSLATAKQLHGKELSFNNIQDANAALEMVAEYEDPAVVAVKHMNPCGIGLANSLSDAFTRAYEADPISIFGGIIACNREVDQATAEQMHEIFLEIVMAPSFTDEAVTILTQKKNIRLLEMPNLDQDSPTEKLTSVKGGILVQTSDDGKIEAKDLDVVTERAPTKEEMADLLFSWKAVKHVKSNAIVLSKQK